MSNNDEFRAEDNESLDFNQGLGEDRKSFDEQIEDTLSQELEQEGASTGGTENEVESTAQKYGHLSKEDWERQGRDPEKWKSPEEFVRYGNEYKEVKDLIKSLKQQNYEQSKKIEVLVDAHKKNAESAVQQARGQLDLELRRAKDLGDVESIERLTQERLILQAQAQHEEVQRLTTERNQIDAKFLERNQHWFNDSRPDLKQQSQQIFQEIVNYYPNVSYADAVRRMEERMKFEHPDIVINGSSKPRISSSNSGINKSAVGHSSSDDERLYNSLSAQDRAEYKVVKKMVEKIPGIKYTVDEFIKSSKRGNNHG